jgi:hypothetical protein
MMHIHLVPCCPHTCTRCRRDRGRGQCSRCYMHGYRIRQAARSTAHRAAGALSGLARHERAALADVWACWAVLDAAA